MQRTDLVVPAALVQELRIPSLAITDGSPDPGWAEVPLGAWRFKRPPTLRLPLDRRNAKRIRRYARLTPWNPVVVVVILAALAVVWSRPGSEVLFPVVVGPYIVWTLLRGALPPQAPSRNRLGDVRIPKVPVGVAREWVAGNPGVTVTDEPEPRPYSWWFYAVGGGGLLVVAVGLALLLVNDGREDFALLWAVPPVLFVAGVSTALKTLPPARPGAGPTFPA